MARGVNKVILVGHLGKDPEMRYTQDGTAICNFSMATSQEWKDKSSGEKREKTEWHRLVAFRKLAEICGEYLVKGKQVYIEGRLQTRSWEQEGVTKYMTEVVINDMQMLGGKQGGGGQQASSGYSSPEPATGPSGGDYDDDIPF